MRGYRSVWIFIYNLTGVFNLRINRATGDFELSKLSCLKNVLLMPIVFYIENSVRSLTTDKSLKTSFVTTLRTSIFYQKVMILFWMSVKFTVVLYIYLQVLNATKIVKFFNNFKKVSNQRIVGCFELSNSICVFCFGYFVVYAANFHAFHNFNWQALLAFTYYHIENLILIMFTVFVSMSIASLTLLMKSIRESFQQQETSLAEIESSILNAHAIIKDFNSTFGLIVTVNVCFTILEATTKAS